MSSSANGPSTWRLRRRQFGLRHMMGLSVVLGLVFAAIAQAMRTGDVVDIILAGLACGMAVTFLGVFLAVRLERWGIIGWTLVGISPTSVALVILRVSSRFEPLLTIAVALFVLPVLIGTMLHVTARLRAASQENLLWVLALAADRGRPLGPAVTALADQSSGAARRRLLRLAECLDHGLTLPDALEFVPKSAPASARLLARVGQDSGALAEALRDAASSRSSRPPGWQSFGGRVGYLAFVLVALQLISAFILYFITPKFEAIFRDFGIGLPRPTIAFLWAAHFLTESYILPTLIALEGLALIYLPLAFSGFVEMHVPIVDRLFLRRHSVLVLRSLAMVVEGERPIGLGLHILARWYPTGWVRDRLAGVETATTRGLDWIDALRRFGLINGSDSALLDAARRAGNLPWALRELADGSARRLGYRLQAVGQVLMTLVLLALGGLVGVSAVAYFYPLVILIERLS